MEGKVIITVRQKCIADAQWPYLHKISNAEKNQPIPTTKLI